MTATQLREYVLPVNKTTNYLYWADVSQMLSINVLSTVQLINALSASHLLNSQVADALNNTAAVSEKIQWIINATNVDSVRQSRTIFALVP
jgi:hypothetical protein